ncbi:hypothetical protein [Enterobacter sp. ECC-019]|uniref:hypothetical protein n=1 Tax=Enterobacter sp. ECC-019 TaxID=3116478 RepID=UPI003754F978
MCIICDDNYYLVGFSSLNAEISRKLQSLPDDVYIITSSSAIGIYFFISRHKPRNGIFFCTERGARLLNGVVNGRIFHLVDLLNYSIDKNFHSKKKGCYTISHEEKQLLHLFAINSSTSLKMRLFNVSYKKLKAMHLKIRKKLQCNNNVELFLKVRMMNILQK